MEAGKFRRDESRIFVGFLQEKPNSLAPILQPLAPHIHFSQIVQAHYNQNDADNDTHICKPKAHKLNWEQANFDDKSNKAGEKIDDEADKPTKQRLAEEVLD